MEQHAEQHARFISKVKEEEFQIPSRELNVRLDWTASELVIIVAATAETTNDKASHDEESGTTIIITKKSMYQMDKKSTNKKPRTDRLVGE